MAFLNRQEREELRAQLERMTFNQAKGRLRRLDPKGRLAFYRNNQHTGRLLTRFDLEGLGTRVTLVEQAKDTPIPESARRKAGYELIDIVVEPTPENRT
jgi:hypothetical protein